MASMRERFAAAYSSHRALIGKTVFEMVIVFVGVTAAFALESVRKDQDEARYRASIIAALIPTLDDTIKHSITFERDVKRRLDTFDAAIARHEQPDLPIYRETGGERPPVRVWDSVVATGAAKALKPDLLFRLAVFYNRWDSHGERYVRYATYTEQRVLPLGNDRRAFYDASGNLRPEFAAYVDRLREQLAASHDLMLQAQDLRVELGRRE